MGPRPRRALVCLGPEFGAVGPDLVRRAAVQANRSIGCDTLLICGFAFDPHIAEEGQVVEKQLGRVKVLTVRMNPGLAMGDALKNTGSGNFFLVFGEPDIELKKQPGGRWVVAIRGLDVFDPTTGEVRSGGTGDVACWSLDTGYDGESFFVRHAYFCGGDPYEKLRRALKADFDEAEWGKRYATESMPFDHPASGRIAVEVINHYGDEVLKVYSLR